LQTNAIEKSQSFGCTRVFDDSTIVPKSDIGAKFELVAGAVLELPISKMSMQMNPGTLVPLEPLGTVYPDIRIVDAWGILTVTKGALIKSDFSRIYVSAPSNSSISLIQGDGWTLELNAGWTITNGERKGNYVLKKSQ